MPNPIPTIRLHPARVLFVLLAITILLVAFSIWGQYIRSFPDRFDIRPWMEFWMDLLSQEFNLNAEGNIPTYFNTILLVAPAVLFAIIAAHKRSVGDKFRIQWTFLAILFLYLSLDEAAVLHERLIKPLRAALDAGNWFYFTWVIPGLIFLAVLALAYLTFFLHLDHRCKLLFLVSLTLYFGGAVGGEMLSGHFAEILGQKDFTFAVISSLEESVELSGASLLIFTLLKYMETYLHEVKIITGRD